MNPNFAPVFVGGSPSDDSTAVAVGTDIELSFSKAVSAGNRANHIKIILGP